MWIGVQGPIIHRVERVGDDVVVGQNVGRLAVRLDRDQIERTGAHLHVRGDKAMDAIAADRVQRLERTAQLVGHVLVEDARPFGEILGAGDETLHIAARVNPGVLIRLDRRRVHQLFVRRVRRDGLKTGVPNSDDCDPVGHNASWIFSISILHQEPRNVNPHPPLRTRVGFGIADDQIVGLSSRSHRPRQGFAVSAQPNGAAS